MKELLRSSDPQIIAEVFNKGGIVVFPTDTVWGIGCIYDNKEAIKRLYSIKNRQPDKPTSLLIPSVSWLTRLAVIIPTSKEILNKYWPGALTVVLPARKEILDKSFVSSAKKVGVRIPNHSKLLQVLKTLDKPILGPSANFAGKPPPQTFSQLDSELLNYVDAVFESSDGSGKESTVITFENDDLVILRDGAVKI